MRSPEEVAREWLGLHDDPRGDLAVETIAALLRERDAEHEAGRREERGRAFDVGAQAEWRRGNCARDGDLTADDTYDAARRAAAKEGETTP